MWGKDLLGVARAVLLDKSGAMKIAGGSLAEAAKAGRLFSVANQSGVTTTAALATTWTGLGVGNPLASKKNYIFHEFGWAPVAVMNTEGAFGLMHGTIGDMAQAIVPVCAKIGAANSAALADNGATVGTPVLLRVFGASMEGALSTVPSLNGAVYDLKGGIVIPPGQALLSYTFAIQTTSIIFHFVWEEEDIP